LEKDGWKGIWVDGYGGKIKYRVDLPEKAEPINLQRLEPDQFAFLARIREKAGRQGGCFDVFAWRGEEHRFVELKRSRGRDRVRMPMKYWLAAALLCGVKTTDLLVVEWDVAI